MFVPPSNQPPALPEAKDHRLTYWLIGGSGVIALGLVALLAFAYTMLMPEIEFADESLACEDDFEDVAEAVRMYAKEKGTFPNAKTWQNDVKSYFLELQKSELPDFFPIDVEINENRMDPEGLWGCKYMVNGKAYQTGFAYNLDLSGRKFSTLKNPESTPLVFEVPTAGMNQAMIYKSPNPDAYPPIKPQWSYWKIDFVVSQDLTDEDEE